MNTACRTARSTLAIPLLIALALFPFCSQSSRAQTTSSGGLTGVVTDSSDAVVYAAVVELIDNNKGIIRRVSTDRDGVYRFFFLAPARYSLTVKRDGFRSENREVDVLVGPGSTANLTLEVASENTTVKVTAEAPLLRAENGDVSTTMNLKQISELPNPGNDLTYVAQMTPGAIMNTDQGSSNFSILGMPGYSYQYTIDGLTNNENSNNGTLSGSLGLVLGQNQIQEATVVSTGYSGQFGEAAGGNISYITKSGNNEFHGNAQYYWNGRILNANDWFGNAFGIPRPFDIANQWACSIGGPIRKNKLFFFVDAEGLRLNLPQIVQVVVPSPQFEGATMACDSAGLTIPAASPQHRPEEWLEFSKGDGDTHCGSRVQYCSRCFKNLVFIKYFDGYPRSSCPKTPPAFYSFLEVGD